MKRNYTLIDASGRPYLTATDRKALDAMIATESVRANTARKQYAIRQATASEFRAVNDGLEWNAVNPKSGRSDKEAAKRMLETIHKLQKENKTCYCLLSWNRGDMNVSNTTKQLFFLN